MALRYFLFFLHGLYLYSAFLEQASFTHTHRLISKPKHFLKFTHSQYNGCIRDSPGFSTMSKDTTCRLGEPGINNNNNETSKSYVSSSNGLLVTRELLQQPPRKQNIMCFICIICFLIWHSVIPDHL